MDPKRDRLIDNLLLIVLLRNPKGIFILEDLIILLIKDSRIVY